jgi:hypothetical protein
LPFGVMSLKESTKEAQKKVDELIKIIRWLDDYRVFKVADPSSIERSIQEFYPSNLRKMWKKVKKDIIAMNYTLIKSPLRRLMAMAAILRSIATTCIMSLILLFMIVVFFRVPLKLPYMTIVLLVSFCLVIIPNLYLYLDRYIRLKIREYNKNLESVFESRIKEVKDLAQQTIFYMNDVIKRFNLDPDKNKFRLRHYDYEGLVLIKKGRFSEFYTVKPAINMK